MMPLVATGELVITGAEAEGAIEIDSTAAGPVPTVLVAETATLNVPNTVGVPAITPVAEVIVRPAGKPVAA